MARTRSDIAPRIVDAARARFLAEGVDGASLRAIAEDAGTSIGMVYYYFKTKDDLFFAVVEETYERLLDDLRRACEPTLPPVERMRRIYRRIGAVSDHESQIVRLVMREVLVSSKRLDRLLARLDPLRRLADPPAPHRDRRRRDPTVPAQPHRAKPPRSARRRPLRRAHRPALARHLRSARRTAAASAAPASLASPCPGRPPCALSFLRIRTSGRPSDDLRSAGSRPGGPLRRGSRR
jgi:AcrR family transcriptional regulator